ncbi:hypothetical protein [Chondromyces apiculatus]|uniref:Lipoprotein n=1 Tax=Chondromyces apiculatus DSM 436 TaxID=1192034 RepID=A0A017TEM2_9BACT|nr:hypothetical protein [Chondromyces apiculatus]EYF07743.1 Hypothetical protein CAP_8244 [Chondromyces apiculatus DSM 436]
MLTPRNSRRLIAHASLIGALSTMTAACGGLGPGDYVGYRVATSEVKPGSDCFPGDEIPDSIKDDTTTFRNGSTFLLYVASDEEALLDTGAQVLAGTIDGDTFRFSGTNTNVEYPPGTTYYDADGDGIPDNEDPSVDPTIDTDNDGYPDYADEEVDVNNDGVDDRIREMPSGLKYTTTSSVTITMTIDGSAVDGDIATSLKNACSGATCPEDYDTSCGYSSSFKGIEVEDVDISISPATGGSNPNSP